MSELESKKNKGMFKTLGAGKALLLMAVIVGVLIWLEPSASGPNSSQVAKAISLAVRNPVSPADVRSLTCKADAKKFGYDCHWQQRFDYGWADRRGHIFKGADGWRFDSGPTL